METEILGYDISQSRQSELRTTTVLMVFFAAFSIVLRFYARWTKRVKYSLDDYSIVFALTLLFILLALFLSMINYGLGVHTAALDLERVVDFGKLLMAYECTYVLTAAVVKIALLLMYCRAFDIRSIRYTAAIFGVVVLLWMFAFLAIFIFQCTPIERAWNHKVDGHCINFQSAFISNAVPNFLIDIGILALPIRALWRLQTSVPLRAQLIGMFLLGSSVVFISIYRMITIFAFDLNDITWTFASPCEWLLIECSSGIIGVCLPTLSPLFQCAVCQPRQQRTSNQNRSQWTSTPSSTYIITHPTRKDGFDRQGEDHYPVNQDVEAGCSFSALVTPPNCILVTEVQVSFYEPLTPWDEEERQSGSGYHVSLNENSERRFSQISRA